MPWPMTPEARALYGAVPPSMRSRLRQEGDGYLIAIEHQADSSSDELARLLELGIGLMLYPVEEIELDSFIQLLSLARRVIFSGEDWSLYSGWESIAALESAEEVEFTRDPPVPIDLGALTSLRSFVVSGRNTVSAIKNPHLLHLGLKASFLRKGESVLAPLRTVSVVGARVSNLDFLDVRDSLTKVFVTGATAFDLASFEDVPFLEELGFFNCKRLISARTLEMCDRLRTLWLDGVGVIDDIDVFDRLDQVQSLSVEANVLFDEVRQAKLSRPHWQFTKFEGDVSVDNPYAPFTVRVVGEQSVIGFSDWEAWAERTGLATTGATTRLEVVVAEELRAHFPDESHLVHFDSEASGFSLVVSDLDRATEFAQVLAERWRNGNIPGRLVQLALEMT